MRLEIINTGTELLLGGTLNTHAHWLGGELFRLGLRIQRQICIPDGDEIRSALIDRLPRCDVIIVTGGLGPTSDDLTREITAELLGMPLEEDAEVLAAIKAYLARRHRELTGTTNRQAMVPRGAQVLPNPFGTAPGLYFLPRENVLPDSVRTPHIFLLPGPPRELKPMYRASVEPILVSLLEAPPPLMRNFKLFGLGEAQVSETLESPLLATGVSELGYCVKPGEVIVRCIGDQAALDSCAQLVRAAFPARLFTESDELMEQVVVRLLHDQGLWLTTAESCTGGLLAHRLTNVPGASTVFGWGFVTYANEAKMTLLGVTEDMLAQHGAVSEPVVRAMADGALAVSGADHALAITGIAGSGWGEAAPEPTEIPGSGSAPGSGAASPRHSKGRLAMTAEKPVGTVFIALASKTGTTRVIRELFPFEREMFKIMSTQTALDLLRRRLLGIA